MAREAQAPVHVGPCARGGKRRVPPVAAEHALHPEAPVTPVGLSLPALADLWWSGSTSKGPSDGRGDGRLRWWEGVHDRFAPIPPWVLHLEKGPEHQSRRPQGMRRLVDCAPHTGVTRRRASSPPSQSQDKPLERCWGLRETHWTGARLASLEAVIRFATTMTWQGTCPVVARVTTPSQTGVTRTQDAMQMVDTQRQRLPGLDKWGVDSVPTSSTITAS